MVRIVILLLAFSFSQAKRMQNVVQVERNSSESDMRSGLGARVRLRTRSSSSRTDDYVLAHSGSGTGNELSINEDANESWDENQVGARSCDAGELDQFQKLFGVAIPTSSDLFVEQQNLSSKVRKGHVLFIYPDQDENGAFDLTKFECYRLLNWALKYQSMRMVHVSSVPEAMELLKLYSRKSLKHLVVGGHGSRTSTVFNSFVTHGKLSIWDQSAIKFWRLADSKLMAEGRVFMDSCLNAKAHGKGKPEDELGNQLDFVTRMLPNHRVFASRISLTRRSTVIRNFEEFHVLIRKDTDPNGKTTNSVHNWVEQGNCENAPLNWVSSNGYDCDAFADKGLCFSVPLYPGAWKDKVAAAKACCKCGGGRLKSHHKGVCPASSVAIAWPSGSSHCKCSAAKATCVRSNGESCPTHWQQTSLIASSFLATCIDCHCVEEDSCPAWSYFDEPIGGNCFCKPHHQCHDGDSKGCPASYGRSTEKFSSKCKTCTCKAVTSDRPFVSCTGNSCKCLGGATCYKGDRIGQCPDPGSWATGEVGKTSSELFDVRCDSCDCRMPCPGDAKTEFARWGTCTCGGDEVKCFKGNSTTPGCTEKGGQSYHEITCKDCACRYTGPYKVGQQVEIRDKPEAPWRSAVITSVRGGKVLACPKAWGTSCTTSYVIT